MHITQDILRLNPTLVDAAEYSLALWRENMEKAAQPPMDMSGAMQGGGAPPGPGGGDPSMMAPPMDPSMMAPQPAAAPAAPMAPGAAPAAPGAAPAAGGKQNKDQILNNVAADVYKLMRMTSIIIESMGIQLPADLMIGPNRDMQTGMPTQPGQTGSTSDPAVMQQQAQQAVQQPGQGPLPTTPPMPGMPGQPNAPKQSSAWAEADRYLKQLLNQAA